MKVDVATAMCLFLMVFAEAGPAQTDDCGRNTAFVQTTPGGTVWQRKFPETPSRSLIATHMLNLPN